jgi:hypothetical protein
MLLFSQHSYLITSECEYVFSTDLLWIKGSRRAGEEKAGKVTGGGFDKLNQRNRVTRDTSWLAEMAPFDKLRERRGGGERSTLLIVGAQV